MEGERHSPHPCVGSSLAQPAAERNGAVTEGTTKNPFNKSQKVSRVGGAATPVTLSARIAIDEEGKPMKRQALGTAFRHITSLACAAMFASISPSLAAQVGS